MLTKEADTPENTAGTKTGAAPSRSIVAIFASVKMTIALMTLIAASILIGAWCPQESQVGQEKIIETFGPDMALNLIQWGIADIFHSPWFLMLIGLLTLNMIACSFQRVFPKIRLLKQPMIFLGGKEIARLPYTETAQCATCPLDTLASNLKRQGYVINRKGDKLTAEFGKFSKAAATVTHIGLLTLLAGVTITSWTGFSGFKPVRLGDDLTFQKSEHSKLWIGKLPTWRVHVNATRREDYETGEAKQWYSSLSVINPQGRELSKQEISVNNPLTYENVDVYQSSWGLDQLILTFNGNKRVLQLRPMGKRYAAFLPLDESTVFIFSLKSPTEPLRVFAKRPDWQSPKLICELKRGSATNLGAVELRFKDVLPVTGLQYKCDPGLPITYVAFGFIILGVMLATVPHRFVWASVSTGYKPGDSSDGKITSSSPDVTTLSIGGRSVKARVGFERSMQKLIESIREQHGVSADSAAQRASDEIEVAAESGNTKSSGGQAKELVAPGSNKEVSG